MSQDLVWEQVQETDGMWSASCPPVGEYEISVNGKGLFRLRLWTKLRHALVGVYPTFEEAKKAAQKHHNGNSKPAETVKPKLRLEDFQSFPVMARLAPEDIALLGKVVNLMEAYLQGEETSNAEARGYYNEMKQVLRETGVVLLDIPDPDNSCDINRVAIISQAARIKHLLERLDKWENP